VRIDGGVVLFTTAAAFLSAALAGLAPALYAVRTDLAAQLRSGRQPGGGGARRGRRALVMTQVALAVIVVAAASLLTRSLLRLQAVDLGLRPDRLLLVSLSVPDTDEERDPRRLHMLDDLVARLRAVPAIENATPVNTEPFAGAMGWDASYAAEGQSDEEAKANPSHNFEAVYPNHFATLGVPVLRGRAFDERDRPGAPEVVMVSEDVAGRLWPGQDPIGKRLKLAGAWRMVVGIVKPMRYRELAAAQPSLYLPAPQFIVGASALIVRTALPPAAVSELVRSHARAVDPGVRVMSASPFRQLLAAPLARPRFNAFLIGLFAAAALLLAAVGLYAVMAAYVRGRQLEIGVRMTLGATPSAVSRLVLGEGLRLAVAGAAIGLGIAAGATRALKALLFASSPLDPASLLGAVLLLVAAAALACYLPARQAARVDPAAVLRAG
jgi:putative ABC transport system permease protein